MLTTVDTARSAIHRQMIVMKNITDNSLKKEISRVERDFKYRLRELDHEKKVFVKQHLGPDVKGKTRKKRRRSTSHNVAMNQLLERLENHRLTDNWVTDTADGTNQADQPEPETRNNKHSPDRSEQEVGSTPSTEARGSREDCFDVLITDMKRSTEMSLPSVPRIGSASSRRLSDTFVIELKGRTGDVSMNSIQDLETKFDNELDNTIDIDSNINRLCVEGSTRNRSVSLPTISKHSNRILNQNGMGSHRSKSIDGPIMQLKDQHYNYTWAQAGMLRSSAGVCMGKVIRDLSHGIPYRDLDDRQSNRISDAEWSRLRACRYLRHRKSTGVCQSLTE